jgi:Membrane-associated phospholipid phosphatase
VGIGYAAAWGVGIAFGFALSRTASWRGGAEWEKDVLRWMHAHPLPHVFDQLMLFMPYLGTNLTMLPLMIGVGALLWWKFDAPLLAVQLLIVSVGSLSLNPTMKHLLNRPRPDLYPLRGMWTWASYPSGHMILTMALYMTVSLMLLERHGWKWPFFVTAFIIFLTGYSRVYLAVHWPTDLIGGLLIGVTWLVGSWTAFAWYRRTTRQLIMHESPN